MRCKKYEYLKVGTLQFSISNMEFPKDIGTKVIFENGGIKINYRRTMSGLGKRIRECVGGAIYTFYCSGQRLCEVRIGAVDGDGEKGTVDLRIEDRSNQQGHQ